MNQETILRRLFVFGVVAATSYAFVIGCSGVDDDGGPSDTAYPDTSAPDMSTPAPDTGPSDMASPSDVATTADTSSPSDASNPGDTSGPVTYRYVLIEDTDSTTVDPTEHVGADIDAVMLSDGSTDVFAEAPTSTAADAAYPEGLAGPQTDPVCLQGAFVSIGTGPMVFQFEGGAAIESGDTITVYEVDQIVCSPSGTDDDSYNVSIGTSSDPNGSWTLLSACDEGQPCVLTVP